MNTLKPLLTTVAIVVGTLFLVFRVLPVAMRKVIVG